MFALDALGFVLMFQTGYAPFSNAPAMGDSAPVLTGTGIFPDGTVSVYSAAVCSANMSVTDMDQWTIPNSSPPTIQTFPNPDTTIDLDVTSGNYTKMLDNFNSASGAHSFTWSVQIITIPPNTYVYKYDRFTAKDTGTITTLNDGSRPQQTVRVYIQG